MTSHQYHSERKSVESEHIDWEQTQRAVRLLLEAIGEDPERSNLTETWQRRLPAALETLTEGNRDTAKPDLRTFDAETGDLVIKTGIPVYSLCEHHLLPYHGTAHVGYRPNGKVVGLSKIPRYVQWQSRRLTIQENLTRDIAEGLADEVNAEAVLVEITATHLCEAMRGVEEATETTTQARVGEVRTDEQMRFRAAITNE